MFEFSELPLLGSFLIRPRRISDARGSFVKTFHHASFEGHGLNTEWQEHYYSRSVAGTVRGLHFQLPPFDHEKLVYCVAGRVVDVLLDLRVGSPTYGQSCCVDLDGETDGLVYIPKGIAHGFWVTESATLGYCVSTQHAPLHDAGVHFRSADVPWPMSPIISERDQALPTLQAFASPFIYASEGVVVS
jgi:dTDP-4-dehydrorhamnose 3,5-epimerase